jgi:hypothetical protein
VLALGIKSRNEVVDEIKGKVKKVYVIEGAEVGRKI